MAELSKAIARLMQERERGQIPAAVLPEDPQLRDVYHAVYAKVASGERPLAEAFLQHWLERAGAEWLSTARPEEVAAAALAAFRRLCERSLEEPRVTVFDPDLVPDGWQASRTVVLTLMRDRPFIVDTVRETLRGAGCTVHRICHPLFAVERDARGNVLALAPPGGLGQQESLVYVEIDRAADPQRLAAALSENLACLIGAVDDYGAMRARAAELAELLRTRPPPRPWNAGSDEVAAFLEWLGQKSFVFLGYREYQFGGQGAERTVVVRRGTGLGILRGEERSSCALPRVVPNALRRRLNEPPLLIVSKTNAESPVHRRAHMDYIGIKEVDHVGVLVGERRFLGLFTSKAYGDEPAEVPVLRRQLAAILEAEGAVEESHDYKAITATFSSIPKVELLGSSVPDLQAEIRAIVSVEETDGGGERGGEVTVVQRPDAIGRGTFVVVLVPRERFSDELYRRIEARLVQLLSASAVLEQRLVPLDDEGQARMHFYLATPEAGPGVASVELRARLANLLRTWDDRLREELLAELPRDAARALAERYTAAFSPEYKAATDVAAAARDIRCLEALIASRAPQVDVTNDEGDPRFTAVKLYLANDELVLSDFLPVLENLGLRVFAEDPLALNLPAVGRVCIHTFSVQDTTGARLDVAQVAPVLAPALLALHAGQVESDRLNALITRALLEWRAVDLLRTYVNHGVQIGTAPSRGALVDALADHPASSRLLWEYFVHKFDPLQPAVPGERLARRLPEIERQFMASLDAVQSALDDRILRGVFAAIAASVRTNYFAVRPADARSPEPGGDGRGGAPAARAAEATPEAAPLAVKLECARIPHLPRPRPLYEVYVHAPHVEALHLRGSKVARGGIRLSDRPDDFRTEILDLMQTQMVKNAVIVPAGAKGGFIAKRRGGAAPGPAQIVAAYRSFIGALLDLTDNIEQGRAVPPPNVLAYDHLDPYLVVAADKGTASFSDTANEIAERRRFWLGDAFASGGTHGYDHKKEGITARGTWECVRRHFREMGRDADRELITVAAIGDMSGDVFGNGLLLSRRLLLRAAFNHQHIFLDPAPDPARAYAERERLFHLPRSTWSDYDTAVLSAGGGVFPRHAKKVALSPEARAMLGLTEEQPGGEAVVQAILRLEVDLLWNGGIGTYVKAGDETHAEVGDTANDPVRIDGAALRAAVVAEGGNLGCTQRGRVEYALRGGRLNTDAIDNSGGVDMSDHEVNLKIALAPAVENGQLQRADRDHLLTELTGEITGRVLAHNRRQARIISLDQLHSQTHLNDFRDLMAELERDGGLDRRLAALPDRETLRRRRSVFLGLTRPELAVLLAHSKLALQQRVLASALPDEPFFEPYLRTYFPEHVNTRFGQFVRSHRLRREIIAVQCANAVIDAMGASFVTRVSRDTGADPVAVVRAWAVAVRASGAAEVWAAVGTTEPPLPVAAETRSWTALAAALERATRWVLGTQPADLAATELSERLTAPVRELLDDLPEILPPAQREPQAAAVAALAGEGVPRTLAEAVVRLGRLAELCEIAHIAGEVNGARRLAAEVYYGVGDLADLDWLQRSIEALPAEGRWERRAMEGLQEELVYARRQLTHDALLCGTRAEECLREYGEQHREPLAHLAALINDVKSAPRGTLAALLVVMRELGRVVGTRA